MLRGLPGEGNMPMVVSLLRRLLRRLSRQWRATSRGYNSCNYWPGEGSATVEQPDNQLRTFFDNRKVGNVIWKWLHYFEIYERHFSRFRGQEVHIAEIGVASGGSLEMWRDYFGPKAHFYGVDINPDCKVYERDGIKVFIGDQTDRSFWRDFCTKVPKLDIVIDGGGHKYEQQVVSLEELLPHLRPNGVYLCEDVFSAFNLFASYVGGLAHKLNETATVRESLDPERRIVSDTTVFQKRVNSIHLYPFVVVVEKNRADVPELVASVHGTEWLNGTEWRRAQVGESSIKPVPKGNAIDII
jgi:hypothetical protein